MLFLSCKNQKLKKNVLFIFLVGSDMLEGILTSLWNVSRVKMGADWSYGEDILITIIVIKLWM